MKKKALCMLALVVLSTGVPWRAMTRRARHLGRVREVEQALQDRQQQAIAEARPFLQAAQAAAVSIEHALTRSEACRDVASALHAVGDSAAAHTALEDAAAAALKTQWRRVNETMLRTIAEEQVRMGDVPGAVRTLQASLPKPRYHDVRLRFLLRIARLQAHMGDRAAAEVTLEQLLARFALLLNLLSRRTERTKES